MVIKRDRLSATSLVLVLMLWSVIAQAQLAGLVTDPIAQELSVVSIDSATGDVTLGPAFVENCCLLPVGVVSSDEATEQFFVTGSFTGGAQSGLSALFTLSFDGESIGVVPLNAPIASVLEFDASTDVLYSFQIQDLSSGLQLVTIAPDSGAVSPVGPPNPNCCEVVSGLSALDADAQRLYFAGRVDGESDWSVFGVDLGTGLASLVEVLPPNSSPGFMAINPENGFLEVLVQGELADRLQLLGIDLVNGGALLLAEYADSDCCLLTPGQTPTVSEGGESWWLAGSNSLLEDAVTAVTRQGGQSGLTRVQPIAPGLTLMAVVVNGETVSLDLVFSDRFQL